MSRFKRPGVMSLIIALVLSLTGGATIYPHLAGAGSAGDTNKCYEEVTEYEYHKVTQERVRASEYAEWGPWSDWAPWPGTDPRWSTSNVAILEGPAPHGEQTETYERVYQYVPTGNTRTVDGEEKPCPRDPVVTVTYQCLSETSAAVTASITAGSDPITSWEFQLFVDPPQVVSISGDGDAVTALDTLAPGAYSWATVVNGGDIVSPNGTLQVNEGDNTPCEPKETPTPKPSASATQPTCTVPNGSVILTNAPDATADASFDVNGTTYAVNPGKSLTLNFAAGTTATVKSTGMDTLTVTFVAASGCASSNPPPTSGPPDEHDTL